MVVVPAVPYRGIQPFRYADHPIFFARERETRLLERLVDVYRGVFLYGDSGNGKSSLVNAGLLPQARELGYEPVRVRVQPRTGEEIVIEPIGLSDDANDFLPCVLAPNDDGHLVLSITDFEQSIRDASREHQPLIIFDQFEEILTLFEDEETVRRDVAAMIVRLLRDSLPVKLLFAFREDYLGRVKQLLAARPELVDQALRLGPPSADALPTMIRGPFERFPGHYIRELTPALAQRLGDALAQRFRTGEVSLSEVQTVCLRLWQSPHPEALLADKGVQGILEDELGDALDSFSSESRAAAIALLSQMVTSAGTRNVISADDLRQRVHDDDPQIAPRLLDEALDRLERESKLVRRERRRDIYLYEITSEFLVPWITDRRDEARLLQQQRREEQRRELERAHERRRRRMIASIACALLIVVAGVSILAVFAFAQRATAERHAKEARHERQLAQERADEAITARQEADIQAKAARTQQRLAQERATDARKARNRARRAARNARVQQAEARRQAHVANVQRRQTRRALDQVDDLQERLLEAAKKACAAKGGSARRTTPTKILCKQVKRAVRLRAKRGRVRILPGRDLSAGPRG